MRLLSYAILLCLLATPVLGLSVSPASSSFTSPQEQELTLRIINSEDVDAELAVSVEDDKGFVFVAQETVLLRQGVRQSHLTVTIDTPETAVPGTYTPRILIQQLPSQTQEMISAAPAIRHPVHILIPRQGLFVTARIVSSMGAQGNNMIVGVFAENVGTQDVNEARIELRVTDAQGTIVREHASEAYRLRAGEKRRFETQWTPTQPGVYGVHATLFYDDQEIELFEERVVGVLELSLGPLRTGPYRYGEILRLDVPVRSEWNKPLKNVHADIAVFQKGVLIDSFVTPKITVLPDTDAVLEGFWNTQGLSFGTYDLIVKAHYGDKTTQKNYSIVLGADDLRVVQETFLLSWQLLFVLLLLTILVAGVVFVRLAKET